MWRGFRPRGTRHWGPREALTNEPQNKNFKARNNRFSKKTSAAKLTFSASNCRFSNRKLASLGAPVTPIARKGCMLGVFCSFPISKSTIGRSCHSNCAKRMRQQWSILSPVFLHVRVIFNTRKLGCRVGRSGRRFAFSTSSWTTRSRFARATTGNLYP